MANAELSELLMEYARLKGLPTTEKLYSVSCTLNSGLYVVIYRQPSVWNLGDRLERLFGQTYDPKKKYVKWQYIDERLAEHLAKILKEVINEKKKSYE